MTGGSGTRVARGAGAGARTGNGASDLRGGILGAAPVAAREVRVTGVVQGVGFRPFVHRLAERNALRGWVRNEEGAVRLLIEGADADIEAFLAALREEAPPLASLERVETRRVAPAGHEDFRVRASGAGAAGRLPVSPDAATCAPCLAELLDPTDRRFGYPFITCTDCGPRYTVITSMPYDRGRTSMRAFRMCPECAAEYATPSDRRFHSQTNACAACGPRIWLERAGPGAANGNPRSGARRDEPGAIGAAASGHGDTAEALEGAASVLLGGGILALRGLGGYHLAADATSEAAVSRLRERKHRDAKPLAVMVASLEQAAALGEVDDDARRLLASSERPIVLLPVRRGAPLAPAVAPGVGTVGAMLPYTPLHYLLLRRMGRPLVMTSGNVSDEPIATGLDEARARLAGIADAFLMHDREIVARYDDSVVRSTRLGPIFLRRARGYAPLPLPLPVPAPRGILAVGPHLKNTFAVAQGRTAWVSPHVGDLENLETLAHFEESLERYRRLFRLEPRAVAHDLHPAYLSTRVALSSGLEPALGVQHHHAHAAAVLAEHGLEGPAIAVVLDGTGFGEDGRAWGAEILCATLTGYRRLAHLRYAPLPGGDLAVRTPWRAALGYLATAPEAAPAFARAFSSVDPAELRVAREQLRARLNAPEASSMGRLFDAAAAVLGVRTVCRYEGQAAMELEAVAGRRAARPAAVPTTDVAGPWTLDPVPLLTELGERRARGEDTGRLAAVFHESVAAAVSAAADRAAEAEGVDLVVLGGGCFQNARLLESTVRRLRDLGLRVLFPRRLSPNDGAISYGQAAVAAALLQQTGGP